MADRRLAVFVFHVINHPVAIGLAKVNVKVGHGDPLRIEEALEQQVVAQRVQVGNFERISHQRTGARTTSRPDWATIVFRPIDKVAHNQKIARKAHGDDGLQLKLQALLVARHLAGALGRIRIQMLHAFVQTSLRGMAEVFLWAHAHAAHQGRGEIGQLRLAQHQT